MSSQLGGPPDVFSLSPLLALLPQRGKLSRLESLVSSLFARHESVERFRADTNDPDVSRRYAAESSMLKQILDWLAVNPEGVE